MAGKGRLKYYIKKGDLLLTVISYVTGYRDRKENEAGHTNMPNTVHKWFELAKMQLLEKM
jgi:hypothetical protein